MSIRVPGATPVTSTSAKPRFDASEIERLRVAAVKCYAAHTEHREVRRTDALADPPSTDVSRMLAFVDHVDGADTVPPHYRQSPFFVSGIFIGAEKRSKSAAYMARARKGSRT